MPWHNLSPDHLNHHRYPLSSLAPPSDHIPSAVAYSQSFDNLVQESGLWTDQDLFFADTDWNFVSINHATPYPGFDCVDAVNDPGYGMASAFASLSDSGSNEANPTPASAYIASSVNSQGETTPPCI